MQSEEELIVRKGPTRKVYCIIVDYDGQKQYLLRLLSKEQAQSLSSGPLNALLK